MKILFLKTERKRERATGDGQNSQTPWTTLSPKFESCFLLPRVEMGGQEKSKNPT